MDENNWFYRTHNLCGPAGHDYLDYVQLHIRRIDTIGLRHALWSYNYARCALRVIGPLWFCVAYRTLCENSLLSDLTILKMNCILIIRRPCAHLIVIGPSRA